MSNSDLDIKRVRLIAEADEGTEIFVIDGGFRRVASALKRMDADFPPGLYTVKFKRGGTLAEVDADLMPGSGPVEVHAPEMALSFASAAPMEQTITSHEYQQAAAADISRMDPKQISRGRGSWLFLFIRDLGVNRIGNPAEKMTLHDLRGREVIDFSRLGETGHDQDASGATWYGCNIELAPGFYRLRVARHGLPGLEQSLILVKDWQLQVFLVRDPWLSAVSPNISGQTIASEVIVNLSAGSIFMVRPGHGFDPQDPSVRLTELARQGLTTGRIPLNKEDLMQMFGGKFENPMLGLFAAHLLLPLLEIKSSMTFQRPLDHEMLKRNISIQMVLGGTIDGIVGPHTRQRLRQLLEEVAGNLEGLLGKHPDVRAIRKELSGNENISTGHEKSGPPPMLRRSWEALLRLDPGYSLAKAGSIIERIADRIWSAGPWLVWEVPPAASKKKNFDPVRFKELISDIRERMSTAGKFEQEFGKAGLSPIEESLMMHSLKQAGVFSYSKAETSVQPPVSGLTPSKKTKQSMAKLLSIPVMTLERNLVSAMAKIDAAVETKKDSLRNLAKKIHKTERS